MKFRPLRAVFAIISVYFAVKRPHTEDLCPAPQLNRRQWSDPPQQTLYSYTAEHKNTAILLSGHSSDMLWVSAKRRKSLWNFVYSGIFWRWHGKSALIGTLYLLGANGRGHGKIFGLSDNAAGCSAGSVFPCPIPGGPLVLRPAIHKKQLEVIGLTVYNDADRTRRKEHQHEQNITSRR